MSQMLAFVKCSHFPVRIPDVSVWGWGGFSLENLVKYIACFLKECCVDQHHPEFLGPSVTGADCQPLLQVS